SSPSMIPFSPTTDHEISTYISKRIYIRGRTPATGQVSSPAQVSYLGTPFKKARYSRACLPAYFQFALRVYVTNAYISIIRIDIQAGSSPSMIPFSPTTDHEISIYISERICIWDRAPAACQGSSPAQISHLGAPSVYVVNR